MAIYTIQVMSPDRLEQIAGAWTLEAGEDEFAVELSEVFENARTHLSHVEGSQHVVELHDGETGEAHALIELVDSTRIALTKLLKLWVSPKYWGLEPNEANIEAIADVFAGAIVSTIRAGAGKGFDDVKIYGRSQIMYDILKHLVDHWEFEGTSASMEGRWMRISLNGKG